MNSLFESISMALMSKATLIGTCLLTVGLAVYSLTSSSTAGDASVAADAKPAPQTNQAKKEAAAAAKPAAAPTLVELSRDAEQKIRQAMQTKIDVTLKDMPLKEFVDFVGRKGKISTWIDETALSEEGIATDEKLNDEQQGVSIEHALNWTLKPLALTWIIDDGILKVTTEINAEERLFTRTYDVHRLIEKGLSKSDIRVSVDDEFDSSDDWLIELLANQTSGPWWEIDGTGGNMDFFGKILVVRQTHKVHDEVANLLTALYEVSAQAESGKSVVSRRATYPHRLDKQIASALTAATTVDYSRAPLSSVIIDLVKQHRIRIRVDTNALDDEGISLDEPITIKSSDVALGSVLFVLLETQNLTYYVKEGVLWITTEIAAQEVLYPVAHHVEDLIGSNKGYEELVNVIQQETSGPWQEFDGTGGTVSKAEKIGTLAVNQTYKVHQEVAQLLTDLRKISATQPAAEPPPKPDPNKTVMQVYDLSKMNAAADLLTAIPRFVEPGEWDQQRKDVVIHKVGESLVIQQTPAMHAKIERFLQKFGYYPRNGFGLGTP